MKKIISIVLFFISAGNCFAQQVTFQKGYGTHFYSSNLPIGDDVGFSVKNTFDGGYVIAGTTNYLSLTDQDICLIKTNFYGDTLWTRIFGGSATEYGFAVQQTNDSGFVIAGGTESFGTNGDPEIYLIKTDVNGNLLWSKIYLSSPNVGLAYSILQTNDGGFIIAGEAKSYGNGCLIKTDAGGNLLWSRSYPSFTVLCAEPTSDNGYILTGRAYVGSIKAFLVKTDSVGIPIWAKSYGQNHASQGNSVKQTDDGGYFIAGSAYNFLGSLNEDLYLIRTDSVGDTLWVKIYGGSDSDEGYSVVKTADGGFVIAGVTSSFTVNTAAYLLKTDGNGDTLWTEVFGYEGCNAIEKTNDGGFIISGQGISLNKTDSTGNMGCNQWGTSSFVLTPPIVVTSHTISYSSLSLTITIPNTIVSNGDTTGTFCFSTGIQPVSNYDFAISISPNPTTNNFTITFPNTINKGSIEIYTVLGKKIFTENVFSVSQKDIHLKNIDAGIYFVKVNDGSKAYCEKLLIE